MFQAGLPESLSCVEVNTTKGTTKEDNKKEGRRALLRFKMLIQIVSCRDSAERNQIINPDLFT